MTAGALLILDLLLAVVATAAWIGAGVTAAVRRPRIALLVMIGASVCTLGRVGTTVALAANGWWFVQEKVLFGLPLAVLFALLAWVVAFRPLLRGQESPVVPLVLLTAGYAAAAALVVTFLFGYPLRISVALVASALVGVAALVTWRMLVPTRSRSRMAIVGGAAAVGVAGIATGFLPMAAIDTGGGHAHGAASATRSVADLAGPAAVPPGVPVRRYELTARKSTATLPSGQKLDAWLYNGKVPGPQLTATEGDLIEVKLRNADIDRGVTLHWHGYDVPNREDGAPGVTQDPVMPGGEFVYRFRANQVGTYWYHTHQVSDTGVRMGLYGTLIVSPKGPKPTGAELVLPVHTYSGAMVLGSSDQVVNHRLRPGLPVRLRLINTDSTPHRFALAGTPFRLAAVDGRDLNEPGEVSEKSLVIAAGGRNDVVFTMPPRGVALYVDGLTDFGRTFSPEGGEAGSFVGVDETAGWKQLDLLSYGKPRSTGIDASSTFDRRFTLVVDRTLAVADGLPKYAYTVDGRAYPDVPVQQVKEGDLVLMTIVNRGLDNHPWHLHGHTVQIISGNGRKPTGSPLLVDTFEVRPGEVWQVAFRTTNPGLWMNHCHNLPHADQGMMLHLEYEGVQSTSRR